MDPGAIIGIVVAFAAIMIGNMMDGGSPAAMLMPSALLIVIGGSIGASMATGLLKDSVAAIKAVPLAFKGAKLDSAALVAVVVGFADRARREGLLSLEEAIKDIEDPFLSRGIQLAVDGTDPEELREILEAQISSKRNADKGLSKFFTDMGAFAPTMGVVGTIMGLIGVLQNLSEPDTLGPLISSAFLTTLWGVLIANLFCLPVSKRLARISEIQTKQMELVLEGVVSVQAGSNPRVVQQKLNAFLAPGERPDDVEEAA
jgi:chemotaxis protein MotA